MEIPSISTYTAATVADSTGKTTAKDTTEKKQSTKTASDTNNSGVIYEKSSKDTTTASKTNTKTTNAALIAKMKADSDSRISQLRGIVEQMITKQGTAIGKADSIWRFLADGNFTVDAATKTQAEADIADDGYWGVNQTSDRIVDFAKALAGNDSSKAEELLNAFKKGFSEATKSWGKSLPDISQRTYDAVVEKFDKWKNGEEE